MREVLDEEDFPPLKQPRDTEVTLGPMAVTGLIFALLLLCGFCFGLGYSMGNHGSKTALTANPTPAATAATASASKPVAAPPMISPAQPAAAATAQSQDSGASSATPQPSDSSAGQPVTPLPVTPLMVQIAVVSQHEDADVLVSALHKRGYEVSLSQDGADGKFHVRVGPFASLSVANAMRQKLLNDGYNAVVQP